MKKLVLFSSLLIAASCLFAQPENAVAILAEARATAAKENKNVFIIFHASWCGWCHKMDTAMNDPAVKKYFDDSYVIRHLTVMESKNKKDLENPGALLMLQKYAGEDSGIPFWVIYDHTGRKLFDSKPDLANGKRGDNVGCPASEKEVDHLISVLKRSSTINNTGLAAIRKRFRQIETGSRVYLPKSSSTVTGL